ncbi:SMP-30/gluconolactonase/LRE family protein [Streptomyces sp. NPDC057682]|uniref:SMP-30/gluconolactonase/LRE family protein n=1 Tax=unclassified Streptomyces TaxID=2593676 RepID=UPI0036656B17
MTPAAGIPAWRALTPARHHLGEGARWTGGVLHYVDLLRGDLFRVPGASEETPAPLLRLGMPLGAVAPLAGGRAGEWIAAAGDGIARLDARGAVEWLARPAPRAGPALRMNDGACDPSGRFWVGSMAADATDGAGALHRTDPDGTVHEVLDGLTVPNGPAFTADGRLMYLADSARGTITRYPVDPATGGLGAPEPFARLAPGEGRPDGMTVDDGQNLWVALWGGGRVLCLGPDGTRRCAVAVPADRPTSVAFGGGLMFVTTARHRLERPGPLDGAVFARPTEVTAPPALPFGPPGGS